MWSEAVAMIRKEGLNCTDWSGSIGWLISRILECRPSCGELGRFSIVSCRNLRYGPHGDLGDCRPSVSALGRPQDGRLGPEGSKKPRLVFPQQRSVRLSICSVVTSWRTAAILLESVSRHVQTLASASPAVET